MCFGRQRGHYNTWILEVWRDFPGVFMNSTVVTVLQCVIGVLFSSMGYCGPSEEFSLLLISWDQRLVSIVALMHSLNVFYKTLCKPIFSFSDG